MNSELVSEIQKTVENLNALLAKASKQEGLMYEVSHSMKAWGDENAHPHIRVKIGEIVVDAERQR